ncbi:MAG: HIT family protein [Pseudomonadota bacterium]|nr:HIT family protein [Pseudomonadota bacterium]
MPFQLHSQLAADTHYITAVENCQVLLMNDARFPWLVLVPMENDIRELYELSKPAQEQTYRAMLYTAELLAEHTHADKMNVAALGNQVPQLHIHIIARYTKDAAWPGPVWGVGQAEPYRATDAKTKVQELADLLTP